MEIFCKPVCANLSTYGAPAAMYTVLNLFMWCHHLQEYRGRQKTAAMFVYKVVSVAILVNRDVQNIASNHLLACFHERTAQWHMIIQN